MKFWREIALGALAVLWLTTAGIAGGLDAKLDTANRAVVAAEVQRNRLATQLDAASQTAREGLKTVDSLEKRLASIPKPKKTVFVETVVDSSSIESVRFALTERTAQRDTAVIQRDSAFMYGESMKAVADAAIQNYSEHLVADTAAFRVMKAEADSLKQSLALVKRATHRPWYKKAGTRVKEAAVLGFVFWLGSKS